MSCDRGVRQSRPALRGAGAPDKQARAMWTAKRAQMNRFPPLPDLDAGLGPCAPAAHISDETLLTRLLPPQLLDIIAATDEDPVLVVDEWTDDTSATHPWEDLTPEEALHHHRRYRYSGGYVDVRRDARSVQVRAFVGEPDAPDAERNEVAKFRLRDRGEDGTPNAQRHALADWTYQTDSDVPSPQAVELSVYVRDPATRLTRSPDAPDVSDKPFTLDEYEQFVREPFDFMEDDRFGDFWLLVFEDAKKSKRYPGQFARPVPGAAHTAQSAAAEIAAEMGYTEIHAIPSHLNVCAFLERSGYRYISEREAKSIRDLQMEIDQRGQYSYAQQAWLSLLQSFEQSRTDKRLEPYQLDERYPLSLNHNIWMCRSLKNNKKTARTGRFGKHQP